MVDTLRYLLQQETTLLVRGPASLRLLAGEAMVLGGKIQRDRSFVVRPERQLPVEAEGEAQLEINLGKSGETFEIDGLCPGKHAAGASPGPISATHHQLSGLGLSDSGGNG